MRMILTVLVIVLVAAGGWWFYREMERPRTVGERLDSAGDDLGHAADNLTADTPGEKLKNDVNHAVDDAQDKTN